MTRLKETYQKEIVKGMTDKFGYKNVMQVPKLAKIVINMGKEDATKKLISVKLDENKSITHDIQGKHTGATVLLKRSIEGTGIIAGGPARNVCELAGIKNIRTKSLGSNNKQNVVLATIDALSQLKAPEEVAKARNKSVEEIVG